MKAIENEVMRLLQVLNESEMSLNEYEMFLEGEL